jgi:MFS family permease
MLLWSPGCLPDSREMGETNGPNGRSDRVCNWNCHANCSQRPHRSHVHRTVSHIFLPTVLRPSFQANTRTSRLICGFGVGAASMINPLYVSENAPRAIRGGLTGLYQLFITMGIMLAFWINYGSLLNIEGPAMYLVPLAMQGLPAVLLFFGMLLCNESPRWLAKQDRWEEARATLCRVRNLPADHPYVEEEFAAISTQLEQERALIAGSSFWDLMKEMWLVPGNRKRAIISIFLMICQQMTGTNAINYYAPQLCMLLLPPI